MISSLFSSYSPRPMPTTDMKRVNDKLHADHNAPANTIDAFSHPQKRVRHANALCLTVSHDIDCHKGRSEMKGARDCLESLRLDMSSADRNASSKIRTRRNKHRTCTCRITMEGNDRTSEFSCTRLRIFPTSLLRYYLRLYIFIFTYFSCLHPISLYINSHCV
jgi:hypothetical protein